MHGCLFSAALIACAFSPKMKLSLSLSLCVCVCVFVHLAMAVCLFVHAGVCYMCAGVSVVCVCAQEREADHHSFCRVL